MLSSNRARLVVMLLLAALVTPFAALPARAEDGVITGPAIVWSRGIVDVDNTVLYSVTLLSGKDALKDVTVTGELPVGATFIEEIWKPESATSAGNKDGKVSWTVAEVAKETFLGPFTVRVSYENSKAADFAAPASMKASVTFAGGSAEAAILEDTISAFKEAGEIKISAKGTTDLVPVGDTGVWIVVPEGAVKEDVTLSVKRLPIDDNTKLPPIAYDTWWCSLFSITADKEVEFSQPIIVVLPTRKALSPGAVIPVFVQKGAGDWVQAGGPDLKDATAEALISVYGDQAYVMMKAAKFGAESQTMAVGISTTLRTSGTTSLTSFSSSSIKSPSISDPAPWF